MLKYICGQELGKFVFPRILKYLNMGKDKKNKIENELEELSWKFMMEVEKIKNEAEEDFLEELEEDNKVEEEVKKSDE